jgi:membrane-bound serine protease (ClpP class)
MKYVMWILNSASILHAPSAQLSVELQQENLSWSPLPLENIIHEVLGIVAVLAFIIVVLFVGGTYLSKTRLFRSMALSAVQDAHQGYTACTYPDSLVGLEGIAQTPLRPAGRVTINNVYYDAKTLGTYVAPGVGVVVTGISGTSLTVQAIHRG